MFSTRSKTLLDAAVKLQRHSKPIQVASLSTQNDGNSGSSSAAAGAAFGLSAAAVAAAALIYANEKRNFFTLNAREKRKIEPGAKVTNLPVYRMGDVNKHDGVNSQKVWVTFKSGVYDVTDFLPKHPGASNIMLAAGSSLEPFWRLYAVHLKNEQVSALLEQYRIGNLNDDDVKANEELHSSETDPYANEPTNRSPKLIAASIKPFNAEPPLTDLVGHFLTPNELFYIRSHLPTPDIKEEEYELTVSGLGVKETIFTLKDLKTKFKAVKVVSAIQCGGNRRAEMNAVKKLKGLEWRGGAIGNAEWTGVRLYDVLRSCGLTEEEALNGVVKHVQFEGYDVGSDGSAYGASIPIEKGFNPMADVILAYEMNGEPLSRDHGFPVRVVVPGVVGARNVKWVNSIIVSNEESSSHWQRNDYKGFNPSIDWGNVDFSKSPAIQSMPVTSAICSPDPRKPVEVNKSGKVAVKGYAWSGGGNKVIRVDYTTDGGKTWAEAEIVASDEKARETRHYGWTLWQAEIPVPKDAKKFEVWTKAVDSNYNVQPESFENIWNLRGLLSNAYSRATFSIE